MDRVKVIANDRFICSPELNIIPQKALAHENVYERNGPRTKEWPSVWTCKGQHYSDQQCHTLHCATVIDIEDNIKIYNTISHPTKRDRCEREKGRS